MAIGRFLKETVPPIWLALTLAAGLPANGIKSLHVECTSEKCSPADMANFFASLEAVKNNPEIASYEVTGEIKRIYDDDDKPVSVDPPNKEIDDDIVSIQRRDPAPTETPGPTGPLNPSTAAPQPVATAPAAKEDIVVVQVVDTDKSGNATKPEGVEDVEQMLLHCSSEEGGCTDEQIAEVENGVNAAGWGFLKPIWDLIRKFKFSYGIDIGNKAADGDDAASSLA